MLAVLQKTIESNTIEELVVSLTYLGRGKKTVSSITLACEHIFGKKVKS